MGAAFPGEKIDTRTTPIIITDKNLKKYFLSVICSPVILHCWIIWILEHILLNTSCRVRIVSQYPAGSRIPILNVGQKR